MESTASHPEEVLHLLGRIHEAVDLSEALVALIDSIVASRLADRAVVLVMCDGELQGSVGTGWGQEEISAASVSLSEHTHPLVRALSGTEVLHVDHAGEIGPLGLQDYSVVPIPGAGVETQPFAILVVSGRDGTPTGMGEIAGRVRRVGPSLHRLAELEEAHRSLGQLEAQRNLHTAILNALPDPVLITDAQNNILVENRSAESLFTFHEGDSGGRHRAVEINNLLFSSFLSRSATGGFDPIGRELNLVDPTEGGDLLYEVLSTPLATALGGDGVVVSVLRDVTDLKRATTELEHQFKRMRQAEFKSRRERDRLNLILENVGDPILVTDDQSNIILMNREAERLFEVPQATDLHSPRRREVRANDTRFSSFISDFTLNAGITRSVEFRLSDPETGRDFPAEVVSGKVFNERSEMTAIVSIIHDLTKVVENERLASELSQLNEQLEERVRTATITLEERNSQLEWQSRELERAYRLKSQFLASMSHELRTPINALLGYTSLMRDNIYGPLTQRQEEALDRMYAASQHLLELVNDILDLAKIEAGRMPIHLEPVDLPQLVREVSLTVDPMVRGKKLDYTVDFAQDLPAIETDRTKVKQIILNLLSNAVKFTHEGGITVRAYRVENSAIELAIEDTGIGIAKEDIPKIFEDFRQVDQSSTREYGGTGLGLSITRKLLGLLGGTIRVESCKGQGSTFTVWLPERNEDGNPEGQGRIGNTRLLDEQGMQNE